MDVLSTMQEFFSDVMELDFEVTPDMTLGKDLLMDDLDCAELAMFVEERFDVEIPMYEIETFQKLQDVIALVEKNI